MNSESKHIPLDRQFVELADEKDMEEKALASYVAHLTGADQDGGWDGIYREGRSASPTSKRP